MNIKDIGPLEWATGMRQQPVYVQPRRRYDLVPGLLLDLHNRTENIFDALAEADDVCAGDEYQIDNLRISDTVPLKDVPLVYDEPESDEVHNTGYTLFVAKKVIKEPMVDGEATHTSYGLVVADMQGPTAVAYLDRYNEPSGQLASMDASEAIFDTAASMRRAVATYNRVLDLMLEDLAEV